MPWRDTAELVGTGLVGLLLVSMLGGAIFGQPVVLGYVETESMAPTLEPGDGFVAVPAPLVGSIEAGDVVVFQAEVIDGGGLTTHRVVGETEGGYVTRGDNNVVTDQDSGEPPVGRDRVVAEVLQIGDNVVVVPGVGVIAGAARSVVSIVSGALGGLFGGQSVAYLVFASGVLAYLWSVYQERSAEGSSRRERTRSDDSIDARVAVLGMAVLMGAVLTGSMLGAGTTHQFDVIATETDSDRQYVIPRGTTENVTYTIPSYGILPAAVFLEPKTDNIEVRPKELYVPSTAERNATVTLAAPPAGGHHPQRLAEHRYLGVLPMGVTRSLYAVHPVLPVVVINLLVGGGVIGLGWALFGNRRIRLGSRSPDRPLTYRLRRWLR